MIFFFFYPVLRLKHFAAFTNSRLLNFFLVLWDTNVKNADYIIFFFFYFNKVVSCNNIVFLNICFLVFVGGQLPDYMEICFLATYNVVNEMRNDVLK